MVGVCYLYNQINDNPIREELKTYILKKSSEDLSLLNKAECALLRIARKMLIIGSFPKLREVILNI